MYFDLIIFITIILLVIICFRKLSSFIYVVAIFDILLRILTFIKNNIGLDDISNLISKYVPESIPAMINNYTANPINIILLWCLLVIYIIFLSYVIKTFWKKRK